ncbi:hypothetical protein O974_22235 [Mycobacterium avium 11-0986]|nr:hypothetical protein O974_22235 [Mycobacterium avium 11-0986]
MTAIGIVLTPKKFVATKAAWVAWLAASSGSVGIAASAAVYAVATP